MTKVQEIWKDISSKIKNRKIRRLRCRASRLKK